jgi:hypothetical protein
LTSSCGSGLGKAAEGELDAFKFLVERWEGKVPQPLAEPMPPPMMHIDVSKTESPEGEEAHMTAAHLIAAPPTLCSDGAWC